MGAQIPPGPPKINSQIQIINQSNKKRGKEIQREKGKTKNLIGKTPIIHL
jgi:hypothetical protein